MGDCCTCITKTVRQRRCLSQHRRPLQSYNLSLFRFLCRRKLLGNCCKRGLAITGLGLRMTDARHPSFRMDAMALSPKKTKWKWRYKIRLRRHNLSPSPSPAANLLEAGRAANAQISVMTVNAERGTAIDKGTPATPVPIEETTATETIGIAATTTATAMAIIGLRSQAGFTATRCMGIAELEDMDIASSYLLRLEHCLRVSGI